VLLHERAVVLGVDGAGAQDDERVRLELADERRVAPQRVGRALLEALAVVVAEPRLEREQTPGRAIEVPRAAVGEVVGERDGVELLRDPHVRQARVVAVRERESISRCVPANGTAGLERCFVSSSRRPPASPARTTTSVRTRVIRPRPSPGGAATA
jgi:hypothetical protein